MQETIGLKDYISQKNRALAALFFLSDRVGRIPLLPAPFAELLICILCNTDKKHLFISLNIQTLHKGFQIVSLT